MLMTIKEYAVHRNRSQGAIYKAVKVNRISRRPDGLIDSETADEEWEQNTDPARSFAADQVRATRRSAAADRTLHEYVSKFGRVYLDDGKGRLGKARMREDEWEYIFVDLAVEHFGAYFLIKRMLVEFEEKRSQSGKEGA